MTDATLADLRWYAAWNFRILCCMAFVQLCILVLKVVIYTWIKGMIEMVIDLLRLTKGHAKVAQASQAEAVSTLAHINTAAEDIKRVADKAPGSGVNLTVQPVIPIPDPWRPGDPDRRRGDSAADGDGLPTIKPEQERHP